MIKIWYFFTKNLKGWTVKAEIFHEDKTYQSQKNISKYFFNSLALHCENAIRNMKIFGF